MAKGYEHYTDGRNGAESMPPTNLPPLERGTTTFPICCPRCGTSRQGLQLFCERLHPFRSDFRFWASFPFLLILAMAVFQSLCQQSRIQMPSHWGPLVVIGMLPCLYWLLLAKLRVILAVLPVIYAFILVGGIVTGDALTMAFRVAPYYLALGLIVLWVTWFLEDHWIGLQTLWAGVFTVGWGMVWVADWHPGFGQLVQPNPDLEIVRQSLQRWTPWFSLAGLLVSLTLRSVGEVLKSRFPTRRSYLAWFYAHSPEYRSLDNASLVLKIIMAPVFAVCHVVHRLAAMVWNSLLAAADLVIFLAVLLICLLYTFTKVMIGNLWQAVIQIVRFAFASCARVGVPFILVAGWAVVSEDFARLIVDHNPLGPRGVLAAAAWKQVPELLGFGIAGLLMMGASIGFMAARRGTVSAFVVNTARDLAMVGAAIVAYASLGTVALWLAGFGTQRCLGLDLGYVPGPLCVATGAVVIAVVAMDWIRPIHR